MKEFYEEEFFFKMEKEKGIFDLDTLSTFSTIDYEKEPELSGIKVRLGNNPIVYNLQKLIELAGKNLTPELQLQFQSNDVYLITHAVGVVRTRGKARVIELQYNAEVINTNSVKIIDLFPKTKFVKPVNFEVGLSGTVKAAGNFSAEVPEDLKNSLSGTCLALGGDFDLELSTHAKFVGKVNYSIKLPVVQSMGIASNKCTWILNPDENPLLGDQILVQTVTVPKGINTLTYNTSALVKISKGWLHETEQKGTTVQTIKVKLN